MTGCSHMKLGGRLAMFATLLGSAFFCLFNETLLSVGDDVLMRRFNLNYVTVQWTMGGFLVAMSVTVPLLAFFIKGYSTKLVVSLALSFCCAGLAIDFFSPSFWILITGRVIEGLGAGFITPLLFFSALTLFSPKYRGHVISICGIACGLGPSLAPSYSGAILNAGADWHFIFLFPFVACFALLCLSLFFVKDISPHLSPSPDSLSVLETLLSFPCLIIGIELLADKNLWGLLLLAVGLLAGGAWIVRQFKLGRSKSEGVLVDLFSIAKKPVLLGLLLIFCLQIANMCLSVVYPLAIEPAFRLTPAAASSMLMAPLAISQVFALLAGKIYDRWGAKSLLFSGFSLMSGGFFALSLQRRVFGGGVAFTFIFALLCFVGVALSTLAVESHIFSLLPSKTADLSTAEQESMQIGGAVGSAACMAIFQACDPASAPPQSYLSAFSSLSIVMTCLYIFCLAVSWALLFPRKGGKNAKTCSSCDHI